MRVSELRAMGRFKRVEVGSSEAISSLQGWSRDEGLCVGTTLTSSVSALCGAVERLPCCGGARWASRDERRLRARMSDSNNAGFARDLKEI